MQLYSPIHNSFQRVVYYLFADAAQVNNQSR